jgi:hypothetical protein
MTGIEVLALTAAVVVGHFEELTHKRVSASSVPARRVIARNRRTLKSKTLPLITLDDTDHDLRDQLSSS